MPSPRPKRSSGTRYSRSGTCPPEGYLPLHLAGDRKGSPGAVARAVLKGELPSLRIGGRVYVLESALLRWIPLGQGRGRSKELRAFRKRYRREGSSEESRTPSLSRR